MRKYLSELHTKPRHHKRRFALLTSAVITLAIFAVWSGVKFSVKPVVVKKDNGTVNLAAVSSENSLENIIGTLKNSWQNLVTSNDR